MYQDFTRFPFIVYHQGEEVCEMALLDNFALQYAYFSRCISVHTVHHIRVKAKRYFMGRRCG